jgi:murein DD-endopeptidase MepM/ murein hydrolase activator NlpD
VYKPVSFARYASSLPTRLRVLLIGLAAVGALSLLLTPHVSPRLKKLLRESQDYESLLGALPVVVPTIKYGFALDTFQTLEARVQPGQVLGSLFAGYGVSPVAVQQLFERASAVFKPRDFQVGKPYMLLSKDLKKGLDHLIYEPSLYEYYVFHLRDSQYIEHVKRPVVTQSHVVQGEIQSTLWEAMASNGASPSLIAKLEDALQWSIDFHHLQQGDQFRALYDQHFVEGQKVDPGRVHAAEYKTGDKTHYAVYYDHGDKSGYYDLEGRPMNKGFLKAPLKFSRISSHFNMSRMHPILKRVRPHFGTDYAAPYGTPILAVGDGEVIEAGYKGGNGNYVKIRHNKKFTTQYLHMQGFARGVRRGVRVQQGQVIGYVGSTGLATGPHVCFRFWMNDKQVNHLRLSFPPPAPLPKAELPAFYAHRDSVLAQLKHTAVAAAPSSANKSTTSP